MARRAFVIGGTGQIGWAICHDLLAHGWEVTVSHRGQSETLPPSGPVHFHRALAAS
jgi:NAD(P)-dependent dehydrogenase (short-subunit alcohol dehydrogenase family)